MRYYIVRAQLLQYITIFELNGLMRHTKVAHSKSSFIIDVGVLLEKYCPKLELEFKVSVFDVFIVSTVSSRQQKF